MFKFLTLATLSLSALSAVSGLAIPVRRDEASYDQEFLEACTRFYARIVAYIFCSRTPSTMNATMSWDARPSTTRSFSPIAAILCW
jgi:hypothetical protein